MSHLHTGTVREAADLLGVPKHNIYAWIAAGRICAWRVGPRRLRGDLDSAQKLVQPISPA
ncbi:excisionase family DNA-binding protein [Prescottella defluvii]|nr:excisionase family DNA-binding protein [Prescottella defluvii]